MATEFEGEKAVKLICTIFEKIDPQKVFHVRLFDREDKGTFSDHKAKIGITGFSGRYRSKVGGFGILNEKKGAVSLYGDEQTHFCIILETGKKQSVFLLDDSVKARRTGLGDSIIIISSSIWKKAPCMEIFLKNIYEGIDAMTYFSKTLLPRINSGHHAARLGKWVTKKVYSRSINRVLAEKMAVAYNIEKPDEETLRTTYLGSDIQDIELVEGNPAHDVNHVLKSKQKYDSATVEFREVIIESDVLGKEIGTKKSKSSYVYLLGTPFSSPVNLIVIRHRSKKDKEE